MGLVIYSVIAWLVLSVFFSLKEKLPSSINIILFLVIQMVQINIFTILSMELKYFTFSKSPVGFISVIVFRDIISPFLLLIFVNLLHFSKRLRNKIFLTVVILIISIVTEQLLRVLGYSHSHNHHWSSWHFGLLFVTLMVFSILAVTLVMKLSVKEKKRYDG